MIHLSPSIKNKSIQKMLTELDVCAMRTKKEEKKAKKMIMLKKINPKYSDLGFMSTDKGGYD